MKRRLILGATGSRGRHVLEQAITAGHQVCVLVRNPAKLPTETRALVTVHQADLGQIATEDLAAIVRGHDALINCASMVTEGQAFVDLVARIVEASNRYPPPSGLSAGFWGALRRWTSARRAARAPPCPRCATPTGRT